MIKLKKQFSEDYTKIYLIFDEKLSDLLINAAFDSVEDAREYAKKEIGEMTEYKIKPIKLYHNRNKSFSNKIHKFSDDKLLFVEYEDEDGDTTHQVMKKFSTDNDELIKEAKAKLNELKSKLNGEVPEFYKNAPDAWEDMKGQLKKKVDNYEVLIRLLSKFKVGDHIRFKEKDTFKLPSNSGKIESFNIGNIPSITVKLDRNGNSISSMTHKTIHDLGTIREFSTTCSKSRKFSDDKMLFVEYEDEDGDVTHQVMKKSELDEVKDEARINRASGAKIKILTEEIYDETNPKHKKYKNHPVTETKEFANSESDREVVPQYIADEVDKNGVIVKYKNRWRIVSKKQKPYEFWDATYNTKEDAEKALDAYHANKGFSNNDLDKVKSLIDKSKDKSLCCVYPSPRIRTDKDKLTVYIFPWNEPNDEKVDEWTGNGYRSGYLNFNEIKSLVEDHKADISIKY